MNNKILNVNDAIKTAQRLRKQNKTIVLVGGVFDILHVGHTKFLEKAKQLGDYLFVLLEDDERPRRIKGKNRPINYQKERAIVLSALQSVDFVILLKRMTSNDNYDKIISQIIPNVIATTYPDPGVEHKIRQGKLINAKVKYVMKRLYKHSATRLANLIKEKNL